MFSSANWRRSRRAPRAAAKLAPMPAHGLAQPPKIALRRTGARVGAVLLATWGLVACSSLLPHGSSSVPSPFASYEDAQAALEKIVPFTTTEAQLATLGFDPAAGANVAQIPYPDILARLVPHPAIPLQAMDEGTRRCLAIQAACRGYSFHFEQQTRTREGSFWPDFLNIRRTTTVRGWRFDALVVVGEGVVLFRSHAGQPRIDQVERQVNPLGPFQPAGESAGQLMRR